MFNDMEFIHDYFPYFDKILDFQIVAKDLGLPLGLASFVQQFSGFFGNIVLDKSLQSCNRGLRPLSDEQCAYSMQDARVLEVIFSLL